MSEIEWYLDELFDQLAGTGAAGRRAFWRGDWQAPAALLEHRHRRLHRDQQVTTERLGVPKEYASFAVPFGAT